MQRVAQMVTQTSWGADDTGARYQGPWPSSKYSIHSAVRIQQSFCEASPAIRQCQMPGVDSPPGVTLRLVTASALAPATDRGSWWST